jgi:hypothetical protein
MDARETIQRTDVQNRALHLMFDQLAKELNDRGLYISKVIKVDAPWNKERVKELIWRPTQMKILNKKSTTQLTTKDIDEVFIPIERAVNELGCDIQFPSIEHVIKQL